MSVRLSVCLSVCLCECVYVRARARARCVWQNLLFLSGRICFCVCARRARACVCHCRARCAARRSTSTGPSPFSSAETSRACPHAGQGPTSGRRASTSPPARGGPASTRWTCCSTAGWCGGLPSTLSLGGATPRQQMPDGGCRSWSAQLDNCRWILAEYSALAPNRHGARAAARRAVLRGLGRGPGPAPPSADPPTRLRADTCRWTGGWLQSCNRRLRSCPA